MKTVVVEERKCSVTSELAGIFDFAIFRHIFPSIIPPRVTTHPSRSHFKMGESVEESPFPLTDVDRWVLSQTDEEFQLHTWDELKEIIGK